MRTSFRLIRPERGASTASRSLTTKQWRMSSVVYAAVVDCQLDSASGDADLDRSSNEPGNVVAAIHLTSIATAGPTSRVVSETEYNLRTESVYPGKDCVSTSSVTSRSHGSMFSERVAKGCF